MQVREGAPRVPRGAQGQPCGWTVGPRARLLGGCGAGGARQRSGGRRAESIGFGAENWFGPPPQ